MSCIRRQSEKMITTPPGRSTRAVWASVRCRNSNGPYTEPAAPSSRPRTGVPTAYGGSKTIAVARLSRHLSSHSLASACSIADSPPRSVSMCCLLIVSVAVCLEHPAARDHPAHLLGCFLGRHLDRRGVTAERHDGAARAGFHGQVTVARLVQRLDLVLADFPVQGQRELVRGHLPVPPVLAGLDSLDDVPAEQHDAPARVVAGALAGPAAA